MQKSCKDKRMALNHFAELIVLKLTKHDGYAFFNLYIYQMVTTIYGN